LRWLWLVILWAVAPLICAQPTQTQITFEAILQKAKERASMPFKSPKSELPDELRDLNYDSYREIQFRHEKALWAKEDLPFHLEFYHPGYLYDAPVHLREFNATHAQPIRFAQDFFEYGKLKMEKRIPAETGYAGFRLLNRLNDPQRWDEVASFLGASYFRMLGQGQRYGTSARGLAINCGEEGLREEFPMFTDWWIGKPDKGSPTVRLYAILDSVSCAGAYEFLVRPGETTFAEVTAVLFLRDETKVRAAAADQPAIKTLGMAPLTSMFWFGENSENRPDDFRAEVHDCDGLLIRGEAEDLTWRPVDNPRAPRHQVFAATNPRGFGLLQRDREFSNYQDLFNLYHKTPSVWVEPRGAWGEGEVYLVELPARHEGVDNIVAFWNPKQRTAPMQPFRFAYTLQWATQPDAKFGPLKVLQTRAGADLGDAAKRKFVIDFGGKNEALAQSPPAAIAHCGENATISDVQVIKNEVSQCWRVIFSLTPKAGNTGVIDIDCALKSGDNLLSETWRYQWSPSSNKMARR
jgi:glucans biosynthesis protein